MLHFFRETTISSFSRTVLSVLAMAFDRNWIFRRNSALMNKQVEPCFELLAQVA